MKTDQETEEKKNILRTNVFINKNIESYEYNKLRENEKTVKKIKKDCTVIFPFKNKKICFFPLCYTSKGKIQ